MTRMTLSVAYLRTSVILAECVTCDVTVKLTFDLSDMEYTVHPTYHSISLSCCN